MRLRGKAIEIAENTASEISRGRWGKTTPNCGTNGEKLVPKIGGTSKCSNSKESSDDLPKLLSKIQGLFSASTIQGCFQEQLTS